jgi:hypothetical protein
VDRLAERGFSEVDLAAHPPRPMKHGTRIGHGGGPGVGNRIRAIAIEDDK